MLAKEKEAASAFIFASGGNRDDLARVMSSPLSTAVNAATGESCRSRPLSPPQWIGLCFCTVPSVLRRASAPSVFTRRWCGLDHGVSYCTNKVLTVNFNSMLSLMVFWCRWMRRGTKLVCVLMQCFVVILSLYREGGCVALISHDARVLWQVTSGVMMDVDWNTQTLCECKALNNVCQCLFTV